MLLAPAQTTATGVRASSGRSADTSHDCRSAREAGCTDVWLVSTNDNLHALDWNDRKGFAVTEVRPGAVDRSRATLKRSIPTHNPENGLPISDEIELALAL